MSHQLVVSQKVVIMKGEPYGKYTIITRRTPSGLLCDVYEGKFIERKGNKPGYKPPWRGCVRGKDPEEIRKKLFEEFPLEPKSQKSLDNWM